MARKATAYKKKLKLINDFSINAGLLDNEGKLRYINLDKMAKDVLGINYYTLREWAKSDEMLGRIFNAGYASRAEGYAGMAEQVLHNITVDWTWTDNRGIERERMQAVNRAKLMVEHYRFHMSKLMPDKYGDFYYEMKQMEDKVKDISKKLEELTKQQGK